MYLKITSWRMAAETFVPPITRVILWLNHVKTFKLWDFKHKNMTNFHFKRAFGWERGSSSNCDVCHKLIVLLQWQWPSNFTLAHWSKTLNKFQNIFTYKF